MQQITYNPAWDIDAIFSGGSDSTELHKQMEDVKNELQTLAGVINDFDPVQVQHAEEIERITNLLEGTRNKMGETFAFISCINAQDVHDKRASLLVGKRSELRAEMEAVKTNFEQKLTAIEDRRWNELLKEPAIHELAFILNEYRDKANELLSADGEKLINDLSVDGYHGWSQMYDAVTANMNVEIEEDGKVKHYSVGQASNKMGDPDRDVRKHVFEQLGKAWRENTDFFGQTLNHLAGFRLQTYKHRNWEHVLKEPLAMNRMKKDTLDAMWNAINRNKEHFTAFLEKKAELLGLEKLSMYDIGAPLSETVKKTPYTDGANFIVQQFNRFSPKMADFAQMAFEKRWIEAEDRPGKRQGGFCTSFPESKQTRIFMTYSGTTSNIATLAHELGHAYHQHVMNDMHGLNQNYAMNVAETASTFAEMIVADASVKNAQNTEEKKALLETKIQRSIAFFMNIQARFNFEQQFYEERKEGMVPVKRLNELMVDAQKDAYGDAIKDYDPNFWASKLHFHITGVPFYNFPYTFGYLFSLGIYAHVQEMGGDFEDDYIELLRDTGRMTVEDLAKKHLDVDLTKPDFWESAISLCVKDVDEFLKL